MNEILLMILVLLAGFVMGTLFFGGLWVTVKKAVAAKIPAIWFFCSFILRVSVVMLGFYYISPRGWKPLVISLLGFIFARIVVTHITKSMDKKQEIKEGYHEA